MTTMTRRSTTATLGLIAAATLLSVGVTPSPADAHRAASFSSRLSSIDDVVAYRHLQQAEDLLANGLIAFR